ncbi:hypothetical protein ABIE64_002670 [Thalassospira sp. MBR-102]|jgi:hypothetical protein|uniref:hypothetical protein n=1 Tax=Thalassospira sp. MBR-102 TaxID=3156466 RepID=UPI003398D347
MGEDAKQPLTGLDRIIQDQAAYYGLTVEQHGKLQGDLADAQELIEKEGEGHE